MNTTDTCNW